MSCASSSALQHSSFDPLDTRKYRQATSRGQPTIEYNACMHLLCRQQICPLDPNHHHSSNHLVPCDCQQVTFCPCSFGRTGWFPSGVPYPPARNSLKVQCDHRSLHQKERSFPHQGKLMDAEAACSASRDEGSTAPAIAGCRPCFRCRKVFRKPRMFADYLQARGPAEGWRQRLQEGF